MSMLIPSLPALIHSSTIVVSVIFPLLSLLAICMRWVARRKSKQSFHGDDYWIVISWVCCMGLQIVLWYFAGVTGINRLKGDPKAGIENSLKCLWLASILVQFPLGAVKISILLFYNRLFGLANPRFKIAIWLTIALIGCWTWLFFFLTIFLMDPISGAFTGTGRARFNSASVGLAQVGTSIALDVLVLCFPIPVIFKLQLSTQRKWAVSLIFWLGAFCVVAAVVRLVLLKEAINTVIDSVGFSSIFVQWKNFIFMILEPNCSIIAACLPTFGPFFKGVWNMEALVRSVRSIFSLQSFTSNSDSRNPTNDYFKFNAPQSGADSTHSQLELNKMQQGHSFGEIEFTGHDSQSEIQGAPGINVTKGVKVVRHNV